MMLISILMRFCKLDKTYILKVRMHVTFSTYTDIASLAFKMVT
jgi:hypothetical protein